MFKGSADSLSVRGLRLHFKEDIKKRVPFPPSPSCAHVPLTMTIYKYRLKQRGALLRCFATLLHGCFTTWLLRYMATLLQVRLRFRLMEAGGCSSRMRLPLVTFDGSLVHQHQQRVFVRIKEKTCCVFQLCFVVRGHLYIAS